MCNYTDKPIVILRSAKDNDIEIDYCIPEYEGGIKRRLKFGTYYPDDTPLCPYNFVPDDPIYKKLENLALLYKKLFKLNYEISI